MFDIRPVDGAGNLDWKKINKIGKIADVSFSSAEVKEEKIDGRKKKNIFTNKITFPAKKIKIYQLGKAFESEEIPVYHEALSNFAAKKIQPEIQEPAYREEEKNKEIKIEERGLPVSALLPFNVNWKKMAFSFASASLIILAAIGLFSFIGKGLSIKGKVLGVSKEGQSELNSAITSIKNQDFDMSSVEFDNAYQKFSQASRDLDRMGSILIQASGYFPFTSKISSGKNAMEAGKHIALAGKALNDVIKNIYSLKSSLDDKEKESISLLEIFRSSENNLKIAKEELEKSQSYIDKIKVDDLPQENQSEFIALKNNLGLAINGIGEFLNKNHIFADLLGGNGPRKYLFLFQNNQEARATGGFIGSYGLLDIYDGRVRNFFVEGIFNPDGQLKDKIVPPKPIQKISAAWSLHDSNWFPDFPTSAKKAILFYEKTGGPTADGIITFTPAIMEKLLEITGPIEMEGYGVVLDSKNFIEKIQYEVEVDSGEEKEPKKILADLAPLVLDRIFNSKDSGNIARAVQVLSEGLSQKHILLYSQNKELQEIISRQGWSGEILKTPKDYLSVINTNINGYKTDGVIDEVIDQAVEIQPDGSIVDTVTITRKHNGGSTPYEWWNKVNADYMRVYVPLGSELLEVEGQTKEFNEPALDYEALNFARDPDVQKEEENMVFDEESGTRMYEDSGKTVFANWVYVSPQETVAVKYKYKLPFKLSFEKGDEKTGEKIDSYSLLVQKQSGSPGSKLNFNARYPENWNRAWNYPADVDSSRGTFWGNSDLKTDKFFGAVFTKK